MQSYQKYKNVVTIIADRTKMPLNDTEINTIIYALESNGAIVENIEWLAEGVACDIFFSVLSGEETQELLTHLLANVPFDFIVQSAQGRRKKLLISDMDSTIIEQECIDELADYVGLKSKVAEITERAMNGELDFKSALRERVALLKGLPENILEEAYHKHITFMPGSVELVSTMKANGARCVLISGGFTFFTERVRKHVGFDVQEANILEIENGVLTGRVKEPILDKQAKLNALKFHIEELNIDPYMSLAIGDGANDLPMLQNAGIGVAYHARPNVRSQVKARINHCDLKSVLYLQGYKAGEIVSKFC